MKSIKKVQYKFYLQSIYLTNISQHILNERDSDTMFFFKCTAKATVVVECDVTLKYKVGFNIN